MRLRETMLIGWMALGVAPPANALTFDFTTIPNDTLTPSQAAAFQSAADAWSAVLSDPFTVTIQVGFRSLASTVLGQTQAYFLSGSATFVQALLADDATSQDDAASVASLSPKQPGAVLITKAQAKALGLAQTGVDGTIEFSSDYGFSTARDANGAIAGGTFDLVGIAMHEIGHLLGFNSAVDGSLPLPPPTVLDLFRYASAGVRSFSQGADAYFSVDGGVTNVANFAVGGRGNQQASHWLQNTGGVFDATFGTNEVRDLTATDIRALDVVGYDLAPRAQVPEPASLVLLTVALAGVGAFRRRRD